MSTREQAVKFGKRTLKRFKGKGWTYYVWNNMGWHCAFRNGPVCVHTQGYDCTGRVHFHALHSDQVGGTGGLACWTPGHKSFSDPNKAALHAIACARAYVDALDAVVKLSERIYERRNRKH